MKEIHHPIMGYSKVTIPDQITPVYGIRTWFADPLGLLSSLHVSHHKWFPGWNEASCHGIYSPHEKAPANHCKCGFYAYNFDHAYEAGLVDCICGIVAFRGKVIIHERGYRAEQAKVVALLRHRLSDKRTKDVGRRYDVPVFKLSSSRLPRRRLKKLGVIF